MIINSIQGVAQLYGANQKKTASVSRSGLTDTAADEVVLSETAQSFAQLLQKAQRNMDTVRQDKVDELSRRIADNTYQVNAQAIADKLLRGSY